MIIWLAFCIPILALIISVLFFTRKVTLLEYLLIFGVPALVIIIAKISIEKCQVSDTEYWNSYAINAQYIEEWDEWINETCTRTNCTGSGEDQECETETYDCSHRDYHPPVWKLTDNLNEVHYINSSHFEFLCKLLKIAVTQK